MFKISLMLKRLVWSVPFSEELGAVQGLADDARSLRRGVGPGGPHDLLHLGQDAGQVLSVLSHDGEVSNSLICKGDKSIYNDFT